MDLLQRADIRQNFQRVQINFLGISYYLRSHRIFLLFTVHCKMWFAWWIYYLDVDKNWRNHKHHNNINSVRWHTDVRTIFKPFHVTWWYICLLSGHRIGSGQCVFSPSLSIAHKQCQCLQTSKTKNTPSCSIHHSIFKQIFIKVYVFFLLTQYWR